MDENEILVDFYKDIREMIKNNERYDRSVKLTLLLPDIEELIYYHLHKN